MTDKLEDYNYDSVGFYRMREFGEIVEVFVNHHGFFKVRNVLTGLVSRPESSEIAYTVELNAMEVLALVSK